MLTSVYQYIALTDLHLQVEEGNDIHRGNVRLDGIRLMHYFPLCKQDHSSYTELSTIKQLERAY